MGGEHVKMSSDRYVLYLRETLELNMAVGFVISLG